MSKFLFLALALALGSTGVQADDQLEREEAAQQPQTLVVKINADKTLSYYKVDSVDPRLASGTEADRASAAKDLIASVEKNELELLDSEGATKANFRFRVSAGFVGYNGYGGYGVGYRASYYGGGYARFPNYGYGQVYVGGAYVNNWNGYGYGGYVAYRRPYYGNYVSGGLYYSNNYRICW